MVSLFKEAKSVLRQEIKSRLSKMTRELINEQSQEIAKQLFSLNQYKESSRIGIYLSLPEEVQTYEIIEDIFQNGKECFIPRYTKTNMDMVKLKSMEDLENLPLTKWKIKQPLLSEDREDAFKEGGLDLVIIPGLAFTKEGCRLGRGKGYYDKYLNELQIFRHAHSLKASITIGLALNVQIVPIIPMSKEDFILDCVLYPTQQL